MILSGPGSTAQFVANGPGGAAVTWSSSNTSVAQIDGNGKVTTAATTGSALITVTSRSTVAYATVIIAQPAPGVVVLPSSTVISVTATGATLPIDSLKYLM